MTEANPGGGASRRRVAPLTATDLDLISDLSRLLGELVDRLRCLQAGYDRMVAEVAAFRTQRQIDAAERARAAGWAVCHEPREATR